MKILTGSWLELHTRLVGRGGVRERGKDPQIDSETSLGVKSRGGKALFGFKWLVIFSLLGNTQKSHLCAFQSKIPSFKRWKIRFYFKITWDTYIKMTWHISEIVGILFLLLTSVNFDLKEIKTTLSGSIALVNSIAKSQLNFLFPKFYHQFLWIEIIA